ncbi:MAG: hypothetical protein ACRDQ7_23800 [Haloechinothrix sp.]
MPKPESVAEFLCPELLADPMIDHDALNDLLRDPSRLAVSDQPDPPPPRYLDSDATVPAHRPDPAEPVEQGSVLGRVSKLAGLAVAMAVLAAAMVAASMTSEANRTRADDEQARSLPHTSLTGVRALIGLPGPDPPPRSPPSRTPATHAEDTTASPPDATAESGWASRPDTSPPPTSTTPERVTKIQAVQEFYRWVAANPEHALIMVSPNLRDSGSEDLVRIWRTVRDITVHEVREEPSGMVRVVVTMIRDNDEQVRMTQLLGVDSGPSPLITEARLLSAQRTSVTQASTGGA